MVNGYVTLDLASKNIYKESLGAIKAGKPVMVVDAPDVYFADTISLSSTSVVITKGGKTITIANDNTITNVGDIQPLMENIVDSQGNNRFIEGDGEVSVVSGVTTTYCKWSLSGSHLMFVFSGTIADTTVLTGDALYARFTLPSYIMDKIFPVWSTNIEVKTVGAYASDWSTQNLQMKLQKSTNTINIVEGSTLTLTAERNFRCQFDLLIDADYSEN